MPVLFISITALPSTFINQLQMKKITLFLCAIITFSVNGQVPSYVPKDSLIGWYPLDSNANDISGNGNSGTLLNGVATTTNRFGKTNSAYHFDGKNDRILINKNIFDNGWKEYSLSFWAYLDTISNPNNVNASHCFFNTSPHNGIAFGMNWGGSGKYGLWVGDGKPSVSWNVLANAQSVQNGFGKQWVLVTLIKNSKTYSLYIDTVLDKSWNVSASVQSYFYKIYFGGADTLNSNEVLKGKLDDLGIWKKALDTIEIKALFKSINCTNDTNLYAKTCNRYIFKTDTLKLSGIYKFTLTNISGCDSIITLNLTLGKSNDSTINVKTCDRYVFLGDTLKKSGIYKDTLTNTSGCDSIITLNLTLGQSNSSTLNVKACESYVFGGSTLTKSGIYSYTTTNTSGCDSVITLNLTINKSNGSTSSATSCNSYVFNGKKLTQSGTYYDTLTNVSGCDSVLTLNLTINKSNGSTSTITACNSYFFNGVNILSSGTYYDTFTNIKGCDSIVTLNLTVNNVSNGVTLNGKTLTATQTFATYQWFDCKDSTFISGETGRTYTPKITGDYAAIITKNSCVDTSACVNVVITGTDELRISNYELRVYPNPTKGIVNLTFQSSAPETIQININDMLGKLVYSNTFNKTDKDLETPVDLGGNPAGMYLIQCVSKEGISTKRIVLE